MSEHIKELVKELGSKDNKIRKNALDIMLKLTQEKVDWVYEIWDILVDKLNSKNSYQRTIGVFLLSNLAKSDYEGRFLEIIDRYLQLTEDEKFIASRQTIQSSYKVAIAIKQLKDKIVNHLIKMFSENKHLNSHANLIRKDIVQSLCNINNAYQDIDLIEIKLKIEMNCFNKERKELEKILRKGQ